MADVLKVLGQSAPLATTETVLYTVPALTQATVSSIVVANRGGATDSFRVSVSVGGGATATKDYIYFNVLLATADTFIATVGISMGPGDVMRVFAGTANLSFSLFGMERS